MEGIAETDWLQLIFPEEIWLLIGNKIHNVHDHLRLRDSSVYFRTLFKNHLERAMFSEVAKVLRVQLQRNRGKVLKVMNKCRLVCRNWQNSVDTSLEENFFPSFLHPFRNEAVDYETAYYNQILHRFSESNSIARFRQHFANTHAGTKRNPFAYRFFWFDYQMEQQENDSLLEQSLQLFREYGHHIWHCVIYLTTTDRNALAHFRKLYEMLELMPNLRTLSLSSSDGLQETTFSDLELHLKTYSLTTLQHLKFLRISRIPNSVTNALMRSSPQITMLDACTTKSVLFQENLPQLELFSTVLNNDQQLRLLQNLSFAWQLKQMNLHICQEIPTKYVFEILGAGSFATLTELKLHFSNYRERLDVAPLQLPNLQTFSLRIKCFTPLDFLFPTKTSLKTLSLHVDSRFKENAKERMQSALDAEEVIKFSGFCDNVLESNIWSIFPNLRRVNYFDAARGFRAGPRVYRRFDWMIKQTGNV